MSKSLGNGVNLGEMIDTYGVDAVRLTMVFAGPPEDDIDWADLSPGGSVKFLQRAWRLSGDVTSPVGTPAEGGDPALRRAVAPDRRRRDPADREPPVQRHGGAHDGAGQRSPARRSTPAAGRPTRRCARPTEAVAILLSLVAPYTAEEMWERLGHQPAVARAGWPSVDPALLVEDTVTAVVQIQGKVKARLEVAPDISEDDLEQLALADPGVVRAIDGRAVRKVIVRAPKLVNIVV